MTYEQAKKLLDEVKDGKDYSQYVIDIALHLMGDLE
jgi:hypothetical protein